MEQSVTVGVVLNFLNFASKALFHYTGFLVLKSKRNMRIKLNFGPFLTTLPWKGDLSQLQVNWLTKI